MLDADGPRHARREAAPAGRARCSRRAGRPARASSRSATMPRARFDHVTVNGKLERDAGDFLLQFADLQLTRGARLERAPQLVGARQRRARHDAHRAHDVQRRARAVHGGRIHGAACSRRSSTDRVLALPGRLDADRRRASRRALRFARCNAGGWSLDAELAGAELERAADHARIGHSPRTCTPRGELRADLRSGEHLTLRDSGGAGAARVESRRPPGGAEVDATRTVRFEDFTCAATPARSRRRANGMASSMTPRPGQDARAHRRESRSRAAARRLGAARRTMSSRPRCSPTSQQGVSSKASSTWCRCAMPTATAVNWQRSSGTLKVAGLAMSGEDLPRLAAGRGTVEFARGSTKLLLDGGELDQLAVTSARLDWPRTARRGCTPRCRAISPRRCCAARSGAGARASQRPVARRGGCAWRKRDCASRICGASARGSPTRRCPSVADCRRSKNSRAPCVMPADSCAVSRSREAGSAARSKSNRAAPARAAILSFAISGVADAAPLLRLLGRAKPRAASTAQLAWTGTAQRLDR